MFELVFGSDLNARTERRFEISIEPLIGVEFWAVAGQVERLNVLLVLRQPCLDGFAVMDQKWPEEFRQLR